MNDTTTTTIHHHTKRSLKFDRFMWAALVLALFSFGMSAFISRTVFERLPHLEDEVAYYFQAQVFARFDLVVDSPPLTRPLWQPFVVDAPETGARFSKYTPGWSALLAIGVALGETWWVNAVCAMLTVLFTYRLGREVFHPHVGIIAAGLVAFSPMALLLNGSLMGHTSALLFATLFMFAYARLMRMRHAPHLWRWGLVAGFGLGMLVINRPLTAIAIATPFVVWSMIRLGRALVSEWASFLPTLRPLVALGVATLLIASAIPIYNNAATGNPTENLYLRVWAYDKVGFGEGFGRNEHTLEKGVTFARYDLSLMAADLFGWQLGGVDTDLQKYLVGLPIEGWLNDAYFPRVGLSWILLLPGLVLGFRAKPWALLWGIVCIAWLAWLPNAVSSQQHGLWLLNGLGLWLVPLMFIITKSATDDDPQAQWTWLLLSVSVALVAVHLAYWIGSQRYSTRYYFEVLSALAILSAIPLAWVIQRMQGWDWRRRSYKLTRYMEVSDNAGVVPTGMQIFVGTGHALSATQTSALIPKEHHHPVRSLAPVVVVLYAIFGFVCLWGLFAYSLPRIDALRGFNRISPSLIEQVNARRTTDKPVLVIVTSEAVSWRSYGALMVATNPYLDSEIVAVWDNGTEGLREQILALFPEREIIEMGAKDRRGGDHAWFIADCTAEGCPVANPPREFGSRSP